uniref:hemerythrin domain-containing protein n=1 Tax=Ningiella ruwaisensis TaxID=2364274 RepID=UPI00109F8F93|nr:hemerythrin domain-containing protein [Ningiella ruwaisensis]
MHCALAETKSDSTSGGSKNIAFSALNNLDTASLISHILERYHEVHRYQLEALIPLAQRVEQVHADEDLVPSGLATHLQKMQFELEQHMQKEEQILFPMLQQAFAPLPTRMIGGPIHVMRLEHNDHQDEIAQLMTLAHHFKLPEDACGTWQELNAKLQAFIEDLQTHIQIENDVLFPRAER